MRLICTEYLICKFQYRLATFMYKVYKFQYFIYLVFAALLAYYLRQAYYTAQRPTDVMRYLLFGFIGFLQFVPQSVKCLVGFKAVYNFVSNYFQHFRFFRADVVLLFI